MTHREMASCFFCVFTFKHLITPELSENDLKTQLITNINLFKSRNVGQITRDILILEKGKNKDNPHLNYVVNFRTKKDISNLRKDLKKIYSNPSDIQKNTMMIKTVLDEDSLIGGYLQKEDEKELIFNNGYDLASAISKAKKIVNPSELQKKSIVLNKFNCASAIVQYADQNDITIDPELKGDFINIVRNMMKNGYSFHGVYRDLGAIFAEVMLLLGNSEFMNQYLDVQINKGFKD